MPASIYINGHLTLHESELAFSFIRSAGPGGQNVNKVSTAVQLRFDLKHSPSLPEGVKRRAGALAGSRLTTEGEIVITSSTHRSQQQNRDQAVQRLLDLLREAAVPPKQRIATRPTLASKKRRLEAKSRRADVKRMRSDQARQD